MSKLSNKGLAILFVDVCDGEPTRYASRGTRQHEAGEAARTLGVTRVTLDFQDRVIRDTVEARLAVARLIRMHQPRYVFTTRGSGVHPDHRAVTEIVVNGVFYARLPKWNEVRDIEDALEGTEPHEIDRLFFGRCRMEPAWSSFDFAVDISETFQRKEAAIAAYASVFHGGHAGLVARYAAEDQYYGALVGVRYAEPFQARGPLLIADPMAFTKVPFG